MAEESDERDDGDRHDSRHRGPGHASPYALSRLAGPVSLVDVAREIHDADQALASVATGKLEIIAQQMRALRKQAEVVLAEAQENAELHRVDARFKRIPGKIYHLYERAEGPRYWSLLAPSDWNDQPPHRFIGSYRLEADQSFTQLSRVAERDALRADLRAELRAKPDDDVTRKLLGRDRT